MLLLPNVHEESLIDEAEENEVPEEHKRKIEDVLNLKSDLEVKKQNKRVLKAYEHDSVEIVLLYLTLVNAEFFYCF